MSPKLLHLKQALSPNYWNECFHFTQNSILYRISLSFKNHLKQDCCHTNYWNEVLSLYTILFFSKWYHDIISSEHQQMNSDNIQSPTLFHSEHVLTTPAHISEAALLLLIWNKQFTNIKEKPRDVTVKPRVGHHSQAPEPLKLVH